MVNTKTTPRKAPPEAEDELGCAMCSKLFETEEWDRHTIFMMKVLKLRHSLIGKSLIPVILKVKAQQEDIPGESLARLKKDHSLTEYNLDDLRMQFEGLTGESVKDALLLCGKEETEETARILLHFAIHQTNIGAPMAKALSSVSAPSTSVSTTPGPVIDTAGPSGMGNLQLQRVSLQTATVAGLPRTGSLSQARPL